jgi:hypothetical protein
MMMTVLPQPSLREQVLERVADADVDAAVARSIVDLAPSGWWDAPVDVLTTDALLIAPGLRPGQLRVRIGAPTGAEHTAWELTVVAPDRRGLLARTASVCARHGMSIRSARVVSWPANAVGDAESVDLALQRLMIEPSDIPSTGEPDWTPLGLDLRAALNAPDDELGDLAPDSIGAFEVESVDDLGDGTQRVRVTGADRIGLLSAITRSLWAAGADIRSAELNDVNGVVHDVFIVTGLRTDALTASPTDDIAD